MKLISSLFLLFCCTNIANSQIRASGQTAPLGFFMAKEFSKEISLYNAKTFVIQNVLGNSEKVIKFQLDALVASNGAGIFLLAIFENSMCSFNFFLN